MSAVSWADYCVQLQKDLGDDQPKQWMWEIPAALNEHIQRVIEKRKNPSRADDDDVDWDDESLWDKNALADEVNWR